MQRSGIDTIKYHTPDPGYQWKSNKLTADTTNKSLEVSPFPAGDHKAHINRRTQRHSKHKTEQKHKRSKKGVPPWNGQSNILLEGFNRFNGANLTLNSDVYQEEVHILREHLSFQQVTFYCSLCYTDV